MEINLLCAEHEVPVQISPFFRHFPDILKNNLRKTFLEVLQGQMRYLAYGSYGVEISSTSQHFLFIQHW